MAKKFFILPTETKRVESPDIDSDKKVDSISPVGIAQGVNYGIFYSTDLKTAAVVLDMEDFSCFDEINGVMELTKDQMKVQQFCEGFSVNTLEKRLS